MQQKQKDTFLKIQQQKSVFFLFLLIIVLSSNFSLAKNHALILGGGEESTPDGEESMFGPEVQNLSQGLGPQWQQTVLFGSDSQTQTPRDGVLSRRNLEKSLNNIVQNAQSGDQVLLYISDHGFLPFDQLNEIEKNDIHGKKNEAKNLNSQTIGLGKEFAEKNGLTRPSDQYFAMANFVSMVEELQKKGVKVAIVNASCYSGNTLKQFEKMKDLCLMNIAGESSMGYSGGYTDIFSASLAKMQTGKYRWDNKKKPIETFSIKPSGSKNLLELMQAALKKDHLNAEVTVLGSSLNTNGHRDHLLTVTGVEEFLTKAKQQVFKRCEQKACDPVMQSIDRQQSQCILRQAQIDSLEKLKIQYVNTEEVKKTIRQKFEDNEAKIDDFIVAQQEHAGDFAYLQIDYRRQCINKNYKNCPTKIPNHEFKKLKITNKKQIQEFNQVYGEYISVMINEEKIDQELKSLKRKIKLTMNQIRSDSLTDDLPTSSQLQACKNFQIIQQK